jgi:hypothetical protein
MNSWAVWCHTSSSQPRPSSIAIVVCVCVFHNTCAAVLFFFAGLLYINVDGISIVVVGRYIESSTTAKVAWMLHIQLAASLYKWWINEYDGLRLYMSARGCAIRRGPTSSTMDVPLSSSIRLLFSIAAAIVYSSYMYLYYIYFYL